MRSIESNVSSGVQVSESNESKPSKAALLVFAVAAALGSVACDGYQNNMEPTPLEDISEQFKYLNDLKTKMVDEFGYDEDDVLIVDPRGANGISLQVNDVLYEVNESDSHFSLTGADGQCIVVPKNPGNTTYSCES